MKFCWLSEYQIKFGDFFWVRGGGRGLLDPKSNKNRPFLDPKNVKFHFFKVLMLIKSSRMTNCGTGNLVTHLLVPIWCKNSNF